MLNESAAAAAGARRGNDWDRDVAQSAQRAGLASALLDELVEDAVNS